MNELILASYIILLAWAIIGVCAAYEIYPVMPQPIHPVDKVILVFMGGPCVWGIALYWLLKHVRHVVLHRLGVGHYDCCGNH